MGCMNKHGDKAQGMHTMNRWKRTSGKHKTKDGHEQQVDGVHHPLIGHGAFTCACMPKHLTGQATSAAVSTGCGVNNGGTVHAAVHSQLQWCGRLD